MPTDNETPDIPGIQAIPETPPQQRVVLTSEDVAEHTAVKPDDLYDLLARIRADYEVEHSDATEDEIPLTRTETICAALHLSVTDFHDLKSRLQQQQAANEAELTVVGQALPGTGGWGWKVCGSGGSAVARWYRITRQRGLLSRGRNSYAVSHAMERAADADPEMTPELLARIRNQTFQQGRLVEDMERLLAELEK